jgi:DEAD/DEAH box helicase domain-containing protein
MAYRGGYLPEERRELERRLFEGSLLGVVSTSALELGIDIGSLRAVIMTGYPGTIASTLQQAGRAGRAQEDALAVLVAQSSSLDQFLMQHPDFLFQARSERALINPENRFIVGAHLLCAAFERELSSDDLNLFGPESEAVLRILAGERYVTERGKWYWIGEGYPAGGVSLRSASGDAYDIKDADREGALLGTVDAKSAFTMVHPGAVYMHMGETYIVQQLDLDGKVAYVRQRDVDYYTDAQTDSNVSILGREEEADLPDGLAKHLGNLEVVEQTVGYVTRQSGETGPRQPEPLELPPQQYETIGLWLTVPEAHVLALQAEGHDLTGVLHAVEHALVALTPVVAPCDVRDIGGVSYSLHEELNRPAVFLYDGFPGGVGICEAAYDALPELLAHARRRIADCPCEFGCPGCVQSPFCGSLNQPLDKPGALKLLTRWTGA